MKQLFLVLLSLLLLAGCGNADPTPVAVATEAPTQAAAASNTPSPAPTATASSTPLPTDTSTPPPTATATATATATDTPSPTPAPVAQIQVLDENGEPLADVPVTLISGETAVSIQQNSDAEGAVSFTELVAGGMYTLTVTADGYQESVETVAIDDGSTDLTVQLTPEIASVPATATTESTAVAAAPTAAPPTNTPPPSAPAADPPPSTNVAGNLLVNPGFENGAEGWPGHWQRLTYTASDKPQFVHSGTRAAFHLNGGYHFQDVFGVTPGTTYRAGVWIKIWSSSGEDRTRSENPGDYVARLCLNGDGEGDPEADGSICTGFVRPLDTWQYLSIDAVPSGERIALILQSGFSGNNIPEHNEALWDDAVLIPSPASATPTPVPPGPAVRPQPVPFDAVSMRDSMTHARWLLEQMGGMLDRLVEGSEEKCSEYLDYHRQLVESPTYHSIPDAWQAPYNEYIFAVEHGINTNSGVKSLCDSGGGGLNRQAYGDARMGINTSLDRLVPAIETANSLLGQ